MVLLVSSWQVAMLFSFSLEVVWPVLVDRVDTCGMGDEAQTRRTAESAGVAQQSLSGK